jgi:hypothetical protein
MDRHARPIFAEAIGENSILKNGPAEVDNWGIGGV